MSEEIKIYTIRLTSGIDLICQLEKPLRGGYVRIRHPFRTMYSQADDGMAIVQLGQWLNFELFENNEYCEIRESDILIMGPSSSNMIHLYTLSLASLLKKLVNGEYGGRVRSMTEAETEKGDKVPLGGTPRKLQ